MAQDYDDGTISVRREWESRSAATTSPREPNT